MENSLSDVLNSPVLTSVAIITLVRVFLFFVCVPAVCVILLKYVKKKKLVIWLFVIILVAVSLFANSKVHNFVSQKEIVYRRLLFNEFKYEHELSGFLFNNSLNLDELIYQFPDSNVYVFYNNEKLLISNYSDVYSYKLSNTDSSDFNKDSKTFLEYKLGNLLNKKRLNPLKHK